MSDEDEPWDPRRVWWQGRPEGPVSLMWRVEVARRNLRDARQRVAEGVALRSRFDEERAAAARRAAEEKAYWASPEGKAEREAEAVRRKAEREKTFAKLHAADMARRRHRLPVWAEWAAWQVAVGKRTHRAIGEALGGLGASAIGRGVMDYVYLNHSDVTAAWYGTGNCPLNGDQRRSWLRRHFAGRDEPAFAGRVVAPVDALPTKPQNVKEYRARNAWIYRQRLAGRTLDEIGVAVDLSRERLRQICDTQEERDIQRKENWSKPKPWRAPRNLGRPIDIGGPRDVWLTYGVPADPRLDNMWPVR